MERRRVAFIRFSFFSILTVLGGLPFFTSCGGNNQPAAPNNPPADTFTPTVTATTSNSPTNSPTSTPTNTATNSPTATPTSTPTNTLQPTPVLTAVWTPATGAFGGVAISGTNLFINNYQNQQVLKFNLGMVPDGSWPNPSSSYPLQLALDSSGNLFVTNYYTTNTVTKFDPSGSPVTSWAVTCFGVAVDGSDNVYVSDRNSTIRKFTNNGALITSWTMLGAPAGIAVAGTTIYAGSAFHEMFTFDLSGTPLGIHWYPDNACSAVAVDGLGRVYVGGENNDPAERFSPTGVLQTQWGNFSSYGIAFDAGNNIYVSDLNSGLRVYSP